MAGPRSGRFVVRPVARRRPARRCAPTGVPVRPGEVRAERSVGSSAVPRWCRRPRGSSRAESRAVSTAPPGRPGQAGRAGRPGRVVRRSRPAWRAGSAARLRASCSGRASDVPAAPSGVVPRVWARVEVAERRTRRVPTPRPARACPAPSRCPSPRTGRPAGRARSCCGTASRARPARTRTRRRPWSAPGWQAVGGRPGGARTARPAARGRRTRPGRPVVRGRARGAARAVRGGPPAVRWSARPPRVCPARSRPLWTFRSCGSPRSRGASGARAAAVRGAPTWCPRRRASAAGPPRCAAVP